MFMYIGVIYPFLLQTDRSYGKSEEFRSSWSRDRSDWRWHRHVGHQLLEQALYIFDVQRAIL
jgi:hypothetical protein